MTKVGKNILWSGELESVSARIENIPIDALQVKLRDRPNAPVAAMIRFSDRVESWVLSHSPAGAITTDKSRLFLLFKTAVNYARPSSKT